MLDWFLNHLPELLRWKLASRWGDDDGKCWAGCVSWAMDPEWRPYSDIRPCDLCAGNDYTYCGKPREEGDNG